MPISRHLKLIFSVSLALAAFSSSSASQAAGQWSEFRTYSHTETSSQFGKLTRSVGDIDFDGTADYLISAPGEVNSHGVNSGIVRLYSGASGVQIRVHEGQSSSGFFGAPIIAMPDVDGDSIPDYVISEPNATHAGMQFAGEVTLYSGIDGATILQWQGSAMNSRFGMVVEKISDFDNDGKADLAIGEAYADRNGVINCGVVSIFSCADGSLIREIVGNYAGANMGTSLHAPGDVNGDGFDDLLVTSRYLNGSRKGQVQLFCGRKQTMLYTLRNPTEHQTYYNNFGVELIALGDWNGDGHLEIAISDSIENAPGRTGAGSVRVYSGKNGAILHTLFGDHEQEGFGVPLAQIGDLDGDGSNDFAIGQPSSANSIYANGAFRVFSGSTGGEITRIAGTVHHGRFGHCIADATDLNGDGRDEVLVGVPGPGFGVSQPPQMQIWSWNP